MHADEPEHKGADGDVPGEHHDGQHCGPVLGGRDLHDADGFGQLPGRDGRMRAGIGSDLPGRVDDGDVQIGRASCEDRVLISVVDVSVHTKNDGDLPGEHHAAGDSGPVLGGRDLHDADGFGQLSGRSGGVRACFRLDVPEGHDDGYVHGD